MSDMTHYIRLIRENLSSNYKGMYREAGGPILNRGFQNWNCLVLNMIAWLEGREVVAEF